MHVLSSKTESTSSQSDHGRCGPHFDLEQRRTNRGVGGPSFTPQAVDTLLRTGLTADDCLGYIAITFDGASFGDEAAHLAPGQRTLEPVPSGHNFKRASRGWEAFLLLLKRANDCA
jgi:hypothetical protein